MIPRHIRSLARFAIVSILLLLWIIWPISLGSASFEGEQNSAPPDSRLPLNQPLRFEHITIEEGLSQNTVMDVIQDRQGYLWIATQEGINRYDGYEIEVFKHNPEDPESISESAVISIYEDTDGYLWVGTWGGGLNRFDPVRKVAVRYQNKPEDPNSLAHDLVMDILEDRQGRLWVATCGGGLNLLDRKTGKFTRFTYESQEANSISSDFVSSLFLDDNGNLWVGTGCFGNPGNGLNQVVIDQEGSLSAANISFTRYFALVDGISQSDSNISSIVQDAKGFLWVGTGGYALEGNGLKRIDPRSGEILHIPANPEDSGGLPAGNIMGLMVDSSGILWTGTWGGGLSLLDLNTFQSDQLARFSSHHHNAYNPESLTSDVAWAFLQDRSGVFWIGTANGGINKLNPQVQRFRLYRNDPGDQESIAHNAVGPTLEDQQGRIWVGSLSQGLDLFDRETGKFQHYPLMMDDPALQEGANAVLELSEDRSGTIWLGTLAGLASLDPETGQATFYLHQPENPNSISNNNITGVVEDHTGRLWVSTLAGLDWLDRTTGKFTHVEIKELASVFRLYLDQDGTLWVGSWGQGLFKIDPDSVQGNQVNYWLYVAGTEPEMDRLADNSVYDILQSRDGFLWLATAVGINRFDITSESFILYQEKDGLANNTTLCLLEDNQDDLWISTNHGLSHFFTKTNTFRNYYSEDGIQSNEFNSGACGKTKNGELYFGGQHGLTVFHPQDIVENSNPPAVVISAFRIFNNPVNADLSGATPIRLAYSDNFIAFEFVGLDYMNPQKHQYAYQLEGFDKNWIQAGTRRYASYTNLKGGEYVFRVRAANSNGVWNEDGVSIPVIVTPPVWQTFGFQVAAGFGLVLVGVVTVRARLESERAQTRRLEKQVQERTAALSQANDQLAQEVDQRKRAEAALAEKAAEELAESNRRFRAVFENNVVGMGFLSLDRKIIEANPGIKALTGFTPDEMLGLNPSTMSFPEDIEIDADLFKELVAGERDGYVFEKRYIRKDGSIFWGRLSYTLIRDDNNQPSFIFGILENIDQQKQAEQELRESEARFRAMFDNAAVGMALLSLDRQVLKMNQTAEKIIGWSEAEMREISVADITYAADRALAVDVFQEMVLGKRNYYQADKRYQRKDGSVFWGRVTYSPVKDETGQPKYMIGIIEDIDEEKRAAEKLAEQEASYRRMLEQRVRERTAELQETNIQLERAIEERQRAEAALAEKAAHEAVAADRTRLARDLHDAVTQTLFSASLLAEVIPQLWEINEEEARKRLVELRELTRGALAEMRTLLLELRPSALTDTSLPDLLKQLTEAVIGRARLPIELRIDGNCSVPPEVQVALYRIAQEALNNVVKYARPSQVSIYLGLQADTIRLSIIDNGAGFEPAKVPPNHLGLRIMRERAEAIGASMNIYSEPGAGTQVTVVWQPGREP